VKSNIKKKKTKKKMMKKKKKMSERDKDDGEIETWPADSKHNPRLVSADGNNGSNSRHLLYTMMLSSV
jgi:hypothetical protein